MYVLSDGINATDINGYWYEKDISTLELAWEKAKEHPKANIIIEFEKTFSPQGWVPTGKTWHIPTLSLKEQ